MSFAAVRRCLIVAHRWLGLLLAPLFLLLILTGLVLSFRPVVNDLAGRAALETRTDAPALAALLRKLEAGGGRPRAAEAPAAERSGRAPGSGGREPAAQGGRGQGAGGPGPGGQGPGGQGPGGQARGPGGPGSAAGPVGMVNLVDGGRIAEVASNDPDRAGRYDVASGRRLGPLAGGPDIFRITQDLHKSLMLGLNLVVEIATWAMAALMIAGPFLVWLRLRNTLMGWHMGLGWLLLPLTLSSPVTGLLMAYHIGPARPLMPRAERPVSLNEAIGIAGRDHDLSALTSARRLRGGTVLLFRAGTQNLVVTDTAASVMTGGPNIFKQIHEGTWAGLWSGLVNAGISLALLALTVTGFISWFARWWRNRAALPRGGIATLGADILVAHASQTGTAARYAAATAAALKAGGERVALVPAGTLAPADLTKFRLVLLIAATTGEGDVPDGARGLLKALKAGTAAGARVALLALGDRSYAHFCGGGETLRAALLAAGATEALPMARADVDPAPAWTAWIESLRSRLGLSLDAAEIPAVPQVSLTLAGKRRLDDPAGGQTQETWHIRLEADADLDFRPGDLVRLALVAGERERVYSIGSSSRIDPRRIELTVRLHHWRDAEGREQYGLGSGALIRQVPVGSRLAARIAPNPAFHPPADPACPIIMVAAGSGIAPFPGFLTEREASGEAGPAWLFFGNRHRAGDFLWSERVDAALRRGALTRLDTAFSRDAGDGARVQARLKGAASEVLGWLMERKAVVYVCGSRALARSVETALAEILAEIGGRTRAAAEAEVARWTAEGRLRVDAFD